MSAFEYQLTRSLRRKSISIVVRRGKVKVMAPVFVPGFHIKQFVASKSAWVLEKLQAQQDWADAHTQKQFIHGEDFLYLGEQLQLQLRVAGKNSVSLQGEQLQVVISSRVKAENQQSHVKKLVKDWYKQTLAEYLETQTRYYAKLMGVAPASVSVRSYTRRWGSCSAKGTVTFNLLLMMAPKWVIDYVIVHELAHLVHLNHSARFWALVERYYPEHKAAKQYLKDHAPQMIL